MNIWRARSGHRSYEELLWNVEEQQATVFLVASVEEAVY